MKKDKKCLNCSRMTLSQDEYISGMQDKIHDLEKENAELKEKMGRAGYRVAELKMQIETMKCCGNCSGPCGNLPIVRKFECIKNNLSLWRLRI